MEISDFFVSISSPNVFFAFTIASLIYVSLVFLGRNHMTTLTKETLTLWLWGEYKSTWTAQFINQFDAWFGEKHFSLRCFLRSSILSLVTVGIVSLYITESGLDSRFEAVESTPLWAYMLVGAFINIFPDYLSLLETRWLLKRFHTITSFMGQLLVLVFDFIVTSIIIWSWISIVDWMIGFQKTSAVQMFMFYSESSIFFYSTFATSIWAWLFCLSTWVMRLFSETTLKEKLETEKKPVSQLALISSILVFLFIFLLEPLNLGKSIKPTLLDKIACSIDSNSCIDISRIYQEHNEDTTATDYVRKACQNGNGAGCGLLGDAYSDGEILEQNDILAYKYYSKGCHMDNPTSCVSQGYNLQKGLGISKNPKKALEIFQQACNEGSNYGCLKLGEAYEKGLGVKKDYHIAASIYLDNCGKYIRTSPTCIKLANLYQLGLGVDKSYFMARQIYVQNCNTRSTSSCAVLGYLYQTGWGVDKDIFKSRDFYERACTADVSYPSSCTFLGYLNEMGWGFAKDFDRAKKLYFQGCEGGDTLGCVYLAFINLNEQDKSEDNLPVMYEAPTDDFPIVVPQEERIVDINLFPELDRKLCEDGKDYKVCTNLGVLYHYGYKDIIRALTFYRKGCDGGDSDGCTQLGLLYEHAFIYDELRELANSDAQAKKWYTEACENLHDARGCTRLGLLLGTNKLEVILGTTYFERGCAAGDYHGCEYLLDLLKQNCTDTDSWSCAGLGNLYINGLGVVRDHLKAISIFEKACSNEDKDSCLELARGYKYGIFYIDDEFKEDASKAKLFYDRACELSEVVDVCPKIKQEIQPDSVD